MRAIVVGGGIGGLACAQGLLTQGVDVVVIERDLDLADTGGYKLHLGPSAIMTLRSLLRPEAAEVLLSSAVGTCGFSLGVRDHRGRLLVRAAEQSSALSIDIDRVTLRLVLADGLGDRLLTGRACRGWTLDGDEVEVALDDGERHRGDVLILADGANSPLVGRLSGGPTAVDTGLIGVAGKSALSELRSRSVDLVRSEPMLAIGPGGTGLFATAHDPVAHPAIRTSSGMPHTQDPIVIWGLLAVHSALPSEPHRLSSDQLISTVSSVLQRHGWAGDVIDLVAKASPNSVAAYRLWKSNPDNLAPWPASRVTAIGDAVHAMPPTGGQGAATAILDAGALVNCLAAADRGELTVTLAVLDYEAKMRAHSAPAVRESVQPLGWIKATANPAGASATRALMPIAAMAARGFRAIRGQQ